MSKAAFRAPRPPKEPDIKAMKAPAMKERNMHPSPMREPRFSMGSSAKKLSGFGKPPK